MNSTIILILEKFYVSAYLYIALQIFDCHRNFLMFQQKKKTKRPNILNSIFCNKWLKDICLKIWKQDLDFFPKSSLIQLSVINVNKFSILENNLISLRRNHHKGVFKYNISTVEEGGGLQENADAADGLRGVLGQNQWCNTWTV